MAITPRTKKLLENYVRRQVRKIMNEEATKGQKTLAQVKELVSKLKQTQSELRRARNKAVQLDIDVPEIHTLKQEVRDIEDSIAELGSKAYHKSEITRDEWNELNHLVKVHGTRPGNPVWGSKDHPNYMM